MKIINNLSLENYNTYRIKSIVKTAIFPSSEEEIKQAYIDCPDAILFGCGSNIIFSKDYYDKTFIFLKSDFNKILVESNIITSQAGATLKECSVFAQQNNLSGLENFFDIPASVGGAFYMNSGAYGECVYDLLVELTTFCVLKKTFKKYIKNNICYGYRFSEFQKNNEIIISAKMNLDKYKSLEDIIEKTNMIYKIRQSKLPKLPSAGSVFKRPKYHISVGEMIENLKLKGFSIGGAEISKKHGGIIVNNNNASGNDIIKIISFIKKTIKNKYNVILETEQIII